MDIQEFSTQFDVLWNNVTSNQAPGLNEYEKSVFLTKAEFQLINEYFNRRTDGFGGGFDGSEKRQYDFSSLIKVVTLKNEDESTIISDTNYTKLDKRSIVFLYPTDYFLAVNELLSDARYQYSIMPLEYGEYQRLMLKPYNFPVKRGAWRLITGKKQATYSATYVNLPDPDEEERWYSNFVTEATNKYYTISIHGDTETIYYKNIDSQDIEEIDLNFPRNGFYFPFYCAEGTFWLGCSYSDVYLLGWNMSTPLNDQKITNILSKVKNKLERYGAYQHMELLQEVCTRLVASDVSDNTTKCSINWSAYSRWPGMGKRMEDAIGLKLYEVCPMVEIIGKFTGEINYQLRYIRTLKPIILEDLTNYGEDLSIEGITQATECELPVETHQEILERAVTLAKIAWAGGTATQAAAQQRKSE